MFRLKSLLVFTVSTVALFGRLRCFNTTHRHFPVDFRFGVATASYQIEGAWNVSDKGENIWDRFSHTTNTIFNGDTGDVACDSYHLFERDVEMLKELGVDFYRFSLSWSRILPTAFDNKISEDGVAFYNKLIDLLVANGITPVVTLYHWDLPQPLQDIGGWANPLLEKYFTDYSRVCFDAFGDRVKDWVTFNEPFEVCEYGYGNNVNAPALNLPGVANYLCGHTLIKAHARTYHLYNDKYKQGQNGKLGISLSVDWYEPEDAKNTDDIEASERALQFALGWFANPIFSKTGDYPDVMKTVIAEKSKLQGYYTSRLPRFTQKEINFIRETSDFFGFNHYSSSMIRSSKSSNLQQSFWDDLDAVIYKKPDWPGSAANDWLKIVPWGFYKILLWIKQTYNNPNVVIMENGFSDFGGSNDDERINFFHLYLNAMLDAMEDGSNVTGYTAWSLMDNFEWLNGYGVKFGLYGVDFDDPNKTRTAKDSATYYANLIKTKAIKRVTDD